MSKIINDGIDGDIMGDTANDDLVDGSSLTTEAYRDG